MRVQALLYGNYVPAAWQRIKQDPDAAPAAIERFGAAAGCRIVRFYFALGEHDLYCFVEAETPTAIAALRHALVASGDFARLHSEMLWAWDEVLPAVKSVRETLAAIATTR